MSVERIRGNDRMNVHYRGLRWGHVGKAISAMPADAQDALEARAARRGQTLAEALVAAWMERVPA